MSQQKSRAFWLKHLHQWHWVSAAMCLVGMVLFSITGFTLNHASWIGAKPEVTTQAAEMPAPLVAQLRQLWEREGDEKAALPASVAEWLGESLSVRVDGRETEWSDEEIYVSLPRPGGDAWLTVNLQDGAVTHELTDRGWLSYFNDLHKGRNTGSAWSLFIDVFAFAALVFAVTGLLLLKMHAGNRPGTWPMVGLGLVLPLLLAILFIH
ncbi:PepSY-associated TM helix domain-containing protein [Steroidobacter gossypii]|uniref:PepSY-associated TM helix domain-containing protein n=1 Tax=Steroidobacter gossypii TaxID=2805490 RepID=UPI00389AA546